MSGISSDNKGKQRDQQRNVTGPKKISSENRNLQSVHKGRAIYMAVIPPFIAAQKNETQLGMSICHNGGLTRFRYVKTELECTGKTRTRKSRCMSDVGVRVVV